MNTRFGFGIAMALLSAVGAGTPARAQDAETEIWHKVREAQFGGRSFEPSAEAVVSLQAPNRAEDAAVVPILIHAMRPQDPQRWVRKIYLIIDKNPSPLGAVFTLTPDSGACPLGSAICLLPSRGCNVQIVTTTVPASTATWYFRNRIGRGW